MQQLIWSDPFYEADGESGKGAKRVNALPRHGPVESQWWHVLSSTQVITYGVLATWGMVITRSDIDPWPCGACILEVQEISNTSNKRIKHTLCIISVYKRGKKRRKVLSPQDDIIWTKTEVKKWSMQVPGLYLGRKDAKRQDASAEGGPESSRRNSKGHIFS